jgi:putative membrane protein
MEDTFYPSAESDKQDKKKKKAEKEELAIERTLLAFERTFLAWIRTAASLMTFGFAIYKLLVTKIHEPGAHPILEVLTPRSIAIILFTSGFLGLLFAAIRFIQVKKKYNQFSNKTFFEPTMLQAYVILLILILLLVGTALGRG